jgi:uridine kinase
MITDGSYLLKSIYELYWDYKIYLKTNFEIASMRGAKRDTLEMGDLESTKQKFIDRYHAASKLYIKTVMPESLADIIIDYSEFEYLQILKS